VKLFSVLLSCLLFSHLTLAQESKNKPVLMIVSAAPGSVPDSGARILADGVRRKYGVDIHVENRPGASGWIGTSLVMKAPADGHTIIFGGFGNQLAPPLIIPTFKLDVVNDLTPVAGIAEFMNVLMVNSKLPVNSVAELIEYAKRRPGELNFGSGGIGNSNHLAVELLMLQSGIKMTHVPYPGGAGPIADLIGGSLHVLIDPAPVASARRGMPEIRFLAVTGRERTEAFKDLPTLIEAGLPEYSITSWVGIWGPAKMPAAAVEKLSAMFIGSLGQPEVQAQLRKIGFQLTPRNSVDFGEFVVHERDKWRSVVETRGLRRQ
jgi:tripartite-type tricarboxylate transporter receptor subunit TctC